MDYSQKFERVVVGQAVVMADLKKYMEDFIELDEGTYNMMRKAIEDFSHAMADAVSHEVASGRIQRSAVMRISKK